MKGIMSWLHPSLVLNSKHPDRSSISGKAKDKVRKGRGIITQGSEATALFPLLSSVKMEDERPCLAVGTLGLELLKVEPCSSQREHDEKADNVDMNCVRVVMQGEPCFFGITNDRAPETTTFKSSGRQAMLTDLHCGSLLANLIFFRRKDENELSLLRSGRKDTPTLKKVLAGGSFMKSFDNIDRPMLSKMKRLFMKKKHKHQLAHSPENEDKTNAASVPLHIISASLPHSRGYKIKTETEYVVLELY